jgi:hypothetical protein
VSDPLSTLESDLTALATPGTDPNAPATATSALTAAQDVLGLLANSGVVQSATITTAVSGVYNAISTAITDDVVTAVQEVATGLRNLESTLGTTGGSDAETALKSLQNVLQTAQSLVPGGSSAAASALAATGQFATLFANLLSDVEGDLGKAADQLDIIAQQLIVIATAFSQAATGN